VAEGKRGDPKRRAPASRPGASGRGRSRPARISPRESRPTMVREESTGRRLTDGGLTEPIRRVFADAVQQQNEDRLGLTARRAAILAAVICVLTLTIAGPVRTYFAQRTEMKQLAASENALRTQIAELESQKAKLADPVYIAAQARERLGFVKPGDIPYQVQLPPGQQPQAATGPATQAKASTDPWYTALWHTIADTPHGPATSDAPPPPPSPPQGPLPPPPPPSAPGG
jgi:cell division protein FtsB